MQNKELKEYILKKLIKKEQKNRARFQFLKWFGFNQESDFGNLEESVEIENNLKIERHEIE
jgi:hypothetical protein